MYNYAHSPMKPFVASQDGGDGDDVVDAIHTKRWSWRTKKKRDDA